MVILALRVHRSPTRAEQPNRLSTREICYSLKLLRCEELPGTTSNLRDFCNKLCDVNNEHRAVSSTENVLGDSGFKFVNDKITVLLL